jgi:two-component system sensor histidine kinase PilS (NtrC family)
MVRLGIDGDSNQRTVEAYALPAQLIIEPGDDYRPVAPSHFSTLRWVYVGRLVLATAIFFAAVSVWLNADSVATLVASLAFIGALGCTAFSYIWTDSWRKPATSTFLYGQVVFDLFLVTAAVHVTWDGSQSEFAPLYILVIAVSALLVPAAGVPLTAALGIVLYMADAMLAHNVAPGAPLYLQIGVFAVVALSSGIIAAKLRVDGAENEELAAELAAFRLRESDMRALEVRAQRLEGVAEMSASLAHEIRNPLASIRSAVEQLSHIPRASEDEQVLSALVQRESDRLSRILGEFLDFARTSAAKTERVNMTEIARNAARLAGSHPGLAPGVRVTEFFPSAQLMIEGDEDLLHRAIYNLLLNAVQASPPNGEVRIEGGELLPNQLPEGRKQFERGAFAILVIDDGAGVPPSIRDRLFDPFVTTKPGGSGLGLSIVQRAAEAHGGLVTVSALGEETRFTLVLPKFRDPDRT